MEYTPRMFELLSAVDRILEDRGNIHRIEREIHAGDEDPHLDVFATKPEDIRDSDLMKEVDKVTVLAREMAQKMNFKTSPIRSAKDRRACRRFDLKEN